MKKSIFVIGAFLFLTILACSKAKESNEEASGVLLDSSAILSSGAISKNANDALKDKVIKADMKFEVKNTLYQKYI
jgi:hypothetical protein